MNIVEFVMTEFGIDRHSKEIIEISFPSLKYIFLEVKDPTI